MEELSLVSLINSFVIFIQNIAIALGFFKLHPPLWLKKLGNLFINLITTIFDIYNAIEEFDAPSKLVFNCILLPIVIMIVGQLFMGGVGVIKYMFLIPFGFILGLGIIDMALNKSWYILAGAGGAIIILIILNWYLSSCLEGHFEFAHVPKSYFLGFLHLIVSGVFLASGLAMCGVIKKYSNLKKIFFPVGAVIHFIIAALIFVVAVLRVSECGARIMTRIKFFLRLNVMKLIFLIFNAIYLPIFQSILNSMMTIKNVCPNGSRPYSYNPRTFASARYFSCLYNDKITYSNNAPRFRYNLATVTNIWYTDMAAPIIYCIIFNIIAYPIFLYLIIRLMHKTYGEESYRMENAGASLFTDYKEKYKYWIHVMLLYKLVVATIQTLANVYVPGLMLLLSFV